MEQEHLGVLHTGGGDAGNQGAVEGGCKNVKIGGRVEVGASGRSALGKSLSLCPPLINDDHKAVIIMPASQSCDEYW